MKVSFKNEVVENAKVYGLYESMVASGYPMSTTTENFEKDADLIGLFLKDSAHAARIKELAQKSLKDLREDTTISEEVKTVVRAYKRMAVLGNAKPASGHDCALKGCLVQFDLKFSQIVWQQEQRYHFIDFISSQSKMHRAVEIDLASQMNKYVEDLDRHEARKEKFLATKDMEDWKRFVYNLPLGMELTARMSTNYLQLKTMYNQRKNHKLDNEWGPFCDFCDALPLFNELTGCERRNK